MRNVKSRLNVIFLFLAVLASLLFARSGCSGQTFKAKVTKTIDGDSIQIRYEEKTVMVRLWGIDTPEWKQPYSQTAKKFTNRSVYRKHITLEVKDWDKYGRMVAVVTTDSGKCLNEELIKNGLAWVHIYYCKEPVCEKWKRFEGNARKNQLGLWQEKKPIPPWVWKRK